MSEKSSPFTVYVCVYVHLLLAAFLFFMIVSYAENWPYRHIHTIYGELFSLKPLFLRNGLKKLKKTFVISTLRAIWICSHFFLMSVCVVFFWFAFLVISSITDQYSSSSSLTNLFITWYTCNIFALLSAMLRIMCMLIIKCFQWFTMLDQIKAKKQFFQFTFYTFSLRLIKMKLLKNSILNNNFTFFLHFF